jgi:PAS domain S-box-containing protein
MYSDQRRFRRTLLQTFLLPPILLTVLAGLLLWEIDRLLKTERLVRHTDEVIAQAHRVESLVGRMETGSRGFLITGEEAFFEPYTRAEATIASEVANLEKLVGDNPGQGERLRDFKANLAQWILAAEEFRRSKLSGGDYVQLVRSGVGKRPMDQMRASLTAFIETEQQLRDLRTREVERWTRFVVGVGIGLTIVLGLFLADFSRRQLLSVSSLYERLLTSLREKADALRASEQRYKRLFESNPQPTWLYDRETLKFLAVNEAAILRYGYSRDEFLSMTIKDIRPADDVSALLENISQVRDRLEDAGIWRHRKKDGTLFEVQITSHPLDFNGRPSEIVLAHDVSKRLAAERALQELNEDLEQRVVDRTTQLEAANRELEAFSYSVSHDLRAPLRAIDGFSRILQEDFNGSIPLAATKYLNLVRNNAKQMGQLIDDLLSFSRIGRQSIRKQRVEPKMIVETVLDELHVEHTDRHVEVDIAELPSVEADPSLLKLVYANLLSNALKYTRNRPQPKIEIGAMSQNSMPETVYYVSDNGAGFDMKYAGKLFGVFQRLHRSEEFEGTGVGLATAQRIISRHGGRIWAEAEVDRGATFFFTMQGDFNEREHG